MVDAYSPSSPHEDKPPSPEAEATTAQPGIKLVTIPFEPKFIKDMLEEVKKATARRDEYSKDWDILLKEYIPTVTASGSPEDVKTNLHFRNTHTKLSQIFYKLPELILEPRRPMQDPVAVSPLTGQPITAEDAITIKKEVLNFKLGEDGIDAGWLMDQILLDCLMYSGHGAAKVGYKPYIKTVDEPVMIPDPNFIPPPPQPGSMLGLSAPPPQPPMVPLTQPDPTTGQPVPVTRPVQVVVFEDWYARRISPKKLLFSNDLRSTRVDQDACWVGMDCFYTAAQLKSNYEFDVESAGLSATATDTMIAENAKDKKDETHKYHVVEMWCKASEYNPQEVNPQVIYQLVLLDGLHDKPLVYRMDPDQTLDDQGKLTPDSATGFPIEVCSLRDHPDSPFVYSDAAFVNNGVKQLNTHRQQSVRIRDASVAKMLADGGAFTKDEIDRIKAGRPGDTYITEPDKLAAGIDKIMVQVPQPAAGRDDYRLAAVLKQDIDEAIGINASEAGITDDNNSKTATEVANAGAKANARLAKDRQRASKFFLRLVRKFDQRLIRYATEDDYVMIEGKVGAKRMEVWNQHIIGGTFAYRMRPDSQLDIDAARSRQQLMSYLKETMGDPMVNRYPIHKKLARMFDLDPAEVLVDPATMALMQQVGMNAPAPGGAPGAGPTAAPGANKPGGPIDSRPHVATGARPNAPEPGSPTPPSTPRVM